MDVVSNNKIIAEFMGGEFRDDRWWFGAVGQPVGENPPLYNESWDWLMPVVDEIEHGKHYPWFIFRSEVYIKENSTISAKTVIKVTSVLDRKQAYYKACVDFVKWYNENN